MKDGYTVNPGKEEIVEANGMKFACYAIKTEVITKNDDILKVIEKYVCPVLLAGDIVFISEKMVACTEGRAYPIEKIKTGFFARMLSRFVKRSPYGIGLAMPETMQCAIDEVGLPRILFASFVGMVGKLFRRRGWFYRVAGTRAASIDGPCSYTLPPYNKYVVLSPKDADGTSSRISSMLGNATVLIIDANDLGCKVLSASDNKIDFSVYERLLRQNPLGQSTQSTPIGILRPLS